MDVNSENDDALDNEFKNGGLTLFKMMLKMQK